MPYTLELLVFAACLLALAGISLVWVAAARMSRLGARRALDAELAHRRVEILAELWSAMSEYEAECFDEAWELALLVRGELATLGAEGLPMDLPRSPRQAFMALAPFDAVVLSPESVARVKHRLEPNMAAVAARALQVERTLVRNRVWLGPALFTPLRAYLSEFNRRFARLMDCTGDRAEFRRRYEELSAYRDSATRMFVEL